MVLEDKISREKPRTGAAEVVNQVVTQNCTEWKLDIAWRLVT